MLSAEIVRRIRVLGVSQVFVFPSQKILLSRCTPLHGFGGGVPLREQAAPPSHPSPVQTQQLPMLHQFTQRNHAGANGNIWTAVVLVLTNGACVMTAGNMSDWQRMHRKRMMWDPHRKRCRPAAEHDGLAAKTQRGQEGSALTV
eukprot:487942-Amphidinium_carterae.2